MDRLSEEIVTVGGIGLPALLGVPHEARCLVVFAHGSGSSRFSTRNQAVATGLRDVGAATVLLDLLTPAEAAERNAVFDIDLITARLLGALAWVEQRPDLAGLPVGFFGASTGAAAALRAQVEAGDRVGAIVSRGGRPDLAHPHEARVTAPTLLIVGGADLTVLDLNEAALRALRCTKELAVIPGAGHLFEEPGALGEVARLAADWFQRHLVGPAEAA